MTSSNEGALWKWWSNPMSPCSVQILSTRFMPWCWQPADRRQPFGVEFPDSRYFADKKKSNRENLLTASWQQFLANFRSGQGKQRVPVCTHKAAFLTAHSPCLTHVVVLLLLLCLNYVNNFLPQYGFVWASVIPVVQCLSRFALLPCSWLFTYDISYQMYGLVLWLHLYQISHSWPQQFNYSLSVLVVFAVSLSGIRIHP